MRPTWIVGIAIGIMLLYFSFYGISGFGSLHPLSVADSSGLHYFVDAYEQGGPYTGIQASILTNRIVDVPAIPMSMNSFIASFWIAVEQRVGNSNPTWFMQIGWYSVAQNLGGTPTAEYYDTVFWATTPDYTVHDVSSITPGEVHNYEIKQETDGWHLIVDGTTVKIVVETGSCTMIDVCEELTSQQPSQWSPAAINCGQVVFSNLEVTAGSKFPFLQSASGAFHVSIDSGSNGMAFNSPSQLTEGWGLSTSPTNPYSNGSPSPTPSSSPYSTPSNPSPSSSSPSPSPSPGNNTLLNYLTNLVNQVLGDSQLMMVGGIFITGLSTIMVLWPEHKREQEQ